MAGLLCCGVTAVLTACGDDDLTGYVPEGNAIHIVQNDLLFTAEGSSASVVVDAGGEITAKVNADWCTAAVSGYVVTVTTQPNSSFEGRTAVLTISAGQATRQLPVQQQGMVLDLPLVTNGHYSPNEGDVYTTTLNHSLPVTVTSPQSWIHPEMDGNTLRVTVDSNVGGHIRRGLVAFECGGIADTLRLAQFDMMDDVVGSYYMMGYYGGNGGAPSATRFDIIQRNDSLFMHWPQESYAKAYIHTPIDKTTCTLFIPSGFTLSQSGQSSVVGYFYDTNGSISASAGVGVTARLSYSESTGFNSAGLVMAGWPGHSLSGFIIINRSFVNQTIFQLGSPVLMRVGPVGTTLNE